VGSVIPRMKGPRSLAALLRPGDYWPEQNQNSRAGGPPLLSRPARLLDRLRGHAQPCLAAPDLTEHAPGDARQMLADRVVAHLEQSGFEIDEDAQVMRKRPPSRNHG
jgi:hypothetical protein